MTTTPIVRQSHFLPDLPDWLEMFVPARWLRQLPMAQGIRIEDFEEDGHTRPPTRRHRGRDGTRRKEVARTAGLLAVVVLGPDLDGRNRAAGTDRHVPRARPGTARGRCGTPAQLGTRSRLKPLPLAGCGRCLALRLGAIYLRPLQEIVGTVALPLTDLLLVVALAAISARRGPAGGDHSSGAREGAKRSTAMRSTLPAAPAVQSLGSHGWLGLDVAGVPHLADHHCWTHRPRRLAGHPRIEPVVSVTADRREADTGERFARGEIDEDKPPC
jgi:hypothetical protein